MTVATTGCISSEVGLGKLPAEVTDLALVLGAVSLDRPLSSKRILPCRNASSITLATRLEGS